MKSLDKYDDLVYILFEETLKESPIPKDEELLKKWARNFGMKVYLENFTEVDLKKEKFFRKLFSHLLYLDLNVNRGYTYGSVVESQNHERPCICFFGAEEKSKSILTAYFEKLFNKDIKNFEISERDYEIFAGEYLNNLRNGLDSIEYLNSLKVAKEVIKKLSENSEKLTRDDIIDIEKFIDRLFYAINFYYFKTKSESKKFQKSVLNLRKEIDKYNISDLERGDFKQKEKVSKELKKLYRKIYFKVLEPKAKEAKKFLEDCIKDLTDENGKLKVYPINEAEEFIRSVRLDRVKDLKYKGNEYYENKKKNKTKKEKN